MKKNKELKFYKVENKLFKAPLSLYVGDRVLYNERMVALDYEDCQLKTDVQDGHIWYDEKVVVIWLPNLKNISIIIHELLHYCFYVYDKKGIPINRKNDELIAYMLEYMFNQIMRIKLTNRHKPE
jgi:hypothetical protein